MPDICYEIIKEARQSGRVITNNTSLLECNELGVESPLFDFSFNITDDWGRRVIGLSKSEQGTDTLILSVYAPNTANPRGQRVLVSDDDIKRMRIVGKLPTK